MSSSISTFQRRAAADRRTGFLSSCSPEAMQATRRSFARIMTGFVMLFLALSFIHGLDVVFSPGARSKVGCGLDARVHYAYTGIYWRAGCAPGAPLVQF